MLLTGLIDSLNLLSRSGNSFILPPSYKSLLFQRAVKGHSFLSLAYFLGFTVVYISHPTASGIQ
jgi:hypothetical protein